MHSPGGTREDRVAASRRACRAQDHQIATPETLEVAEGRGARGSREPRSLRRGALSRPLCTSSKKGRGCVPEVLKENARALDSCVQPASSQREARGHVLGQETRAVRHPQASLVLPLKMKRPF